MVFCDACDICVHQVSESLSMKATAYGNTVLLYMELVASMSYPTTGQHYLRWSALNFVPEMCRVSILVTWSSSYDLVYYKYIQIKERKPVAGSIILYCQLSVGQGV